VTSQTDDQPDCATGLEACRSHDRRQRTDVPMCAVGRLVTCVCAMTLAVAARRIYQMLLAGMSAGQERDA
jgi:hypothetical protein